MTTRTDAPGATALSLLGLALSTLLIAGCASVQPAGTQVAAADVRVAVAVAASAATKAASSPQAVVVAAAPAEPETPAPAPVPVDPVRPGVHLDLDDRSARVDLWERVRKGFAMSDIDSELVRDRERWYASRPDYVARMTDRGSRYLFYIVEELDKRGMPTELALLPFIESAYNPQAMSVARASGMWQFIPSTGRDFALKQNLFRDDRRDVLASTRAALDYLKKLYGMFGDWHLALAAYNWGEGSVQRAIAKNQRAGLPTDYQSLRMPAETQGYVPKLQAVKNIIARPADFNIRLPELMNHPYFLSVPIERDIDVAVAVQLAGLPIDEFQSLNPQMNRPVILAAGTPQLLLPYDNANRFVRELPRHRGPLASWTAWVAPRTMKTAEAAHNVGMSEEGLREVNHIPARMLIKSGSTLLVPRASSLLTNVSSTVADNASLALAPDVPPPRRVALKAGRHETVASVAKRYRVSAAQVAQWNDVNTTAKFAPGQSVVVFVAQSPKKPRSGSRLGPRGQTAHAAEMKNTSPRAVARPPSASRSVKSAPARKHVRSGHP